MKPIRNSAKAVIIRNDQVLLTKNQDDQGYFFYLFPGGGQEPGEQLSDAVKRECLEEIGEQVEVHELLCVREYIGKNHQFADWDSAVHQVEFYFSCTLTAEEPAFQNITNPDSFQVGVEWVELSQLHAIQVYPRTLASMLTEPATTLRYLGDAN
ncbi:NUDIX domain-containing protein [Paenibacillus koleovorans]|uniref:NUDIX domain-containing protein n=1 Tax=Paenibacillus koleovorans TaxID=121608 RepID=UPI000FD6C2CF|nr:NUDIX domain-containing protein [Paenibacillus koleovorans]